MTESEGQLAVALKRLSAQFRTEQRQHADEHRRHSEQVEALQQRVERRPRRTRSCGSESSSRPRRTRPLRLQFERLDGQVTRLAQDYETLAATLRELWR